MRRAWTAAAAAVVACGIPGRPPGTTGFSSTTIGTTTTLPAPPLSLTAESTTIAPLTDLVLGFAGDTLFTSGLAEADPLAAAAGLTGAPHLMAVNLETVVAEEGVGQPADQEFTFLSPPGSVQLLQEAGIDVAGLANNHTLDFGAQGLDRTIELLGAAGLRTAGAGGNAAEAYAPVVTEVSGRSIAVIALSRVLPTEEWAAEDDRPGVASATDEALGRSAEAVRAAAQSADVVVVMIHWGIELDACPQPRQRDLARSWIEAGASMVVGSHPHVLQGLELVQGAAVIYSTGNFVFPSARGPTGDTALFYVTFDAAGIAKVRALPLVIVDGKPQPASGQDAVRILGVLGARSFGWEFPDGVATPSAAVGLCGE